MGAVMTRTPAEIYKDIEASKSGRESLCTGSTPAECLPIVESYRVAYERERELWSELASALIHGPGEPWMLAAARGAASNALEGEIRAEERLERLRAQIAKDAPVRPA